MPEYSHTVLRSSSKRLLQWAVHSSTRAIGERRASVLDPRPPFPPVQRDHRRQSDTSLFQDILVITQHVQGRISHDELVGRFTLGASYEDTQL